jgi:hypothetical protein
MAPNLEAAVELVKQGEEYLRLAALDGAPCQKAGSKIGLRTDTASI